MMYDVEFAKKLMDFSLKINTFYQFLLAWTGYKIEGKDGYGNKVVNYSMILQAVYSKYEEDESIKNLLEDTLLKQIIKNQNPEDLVTIIQLIKCQLSKEQDGFAPFKIDNDKLLEAIKEKIEKYKDAYSRPVQSLATGSYLAEFKVYNDDLYKNFGKTIF